VVPPEVEVVVVGGSTAETVVQVRNLGGTDLVFQVPQPSLSVPAAERSAPPVFERGADPRVGDPVTDSFGGPDTYGYRWEDSDEPGGPVFSWVDIRGTGTLAPVYGDEDVSIPIALGFEFPFYGDTLTGPATFSSVRIAANGWLSFTDPRVPTYFVNPVPGVYSPFNLIAPFWSDLNLGGVQRIWYRQEAGRFIVSWVGVPHFSYGGPFTFQAILHEDGGILFQYLDVQPPLAAHSIGIQNANGTIGLQVAYSTPYVRPGLAVRLATGPRWLSAEPDYGVVPPGGALDLTLHVDATELAYGDHRASLVLTTNDPDETRVVVPVLARVVDLPDIAADSLDFGPQYVGHPADRTLWVRNRGLMPLVVTGAEVAGADFTRLGPDLPFTVGGRDSVEVMIRFAPSAVCDPCVGTITLVSTDPDGPFVVALGGAARIPPGIAWDPDSLRAALAHTLGPAALTAERTIHVANAGGSPLEVYIQRLSVPGPGAVAAREAGEGVLRSGGPDAFGYAWADSDEPGGPVFDWIEITSPANQLALEGNDRVISVPLPFAFPFYDGSFHSVNVSTNGWLSFTSVAIPGRDNLRLPSAAPGVPENLLAPLWDNLNFGTSRRAYAAGGPDRFVLTYLNVPTASVGGGPYTFQVILYPGGRIVYQYLALGNLHATATVGMQDATRTVGLDISHNEFYLHPGLAIEISAGPEWLDVQPVSVVVPPGEAADLTVTMDASGLPDGDHAAAVRLVSNDIETPVVEVPVHVHVGVLPVTFDIDPNHLNRTSHGRWVSGTVVLPEGWDPQGIDVSSVLVQDAVPVDPDGPVSFEEGGARYKFGREAVMAAIPDGENVPVRVVGTVGDRSWFAGLDLVRMLRPEAEAPGSSYIAGSRVPLAWSDAEGHPASGYDLWYSADGGEVWSLVAGGLTTRAWDWRVPVEPTEDGRLELVAWDAVGVMGSWVSTPLRVVPATSGVASDRPAAFGMRLSGAHPVRGVANLELAIPERAQVRLAVYDLRGARVRTLLDGEREAGWHPVRWDGRDAAGRPAGPGV
jgi:hypothetical protein